MMFCSVQRVFTSISSWTGRGLRNSVASTPCTPRRTLTLTLPSLSSLFLGLRTCMGCAAMLSFHVGSEEGLWLWEGAPSCNPSSSLLILLPFSSQTHAPPWCIWAPLFLCLPEGRNSRLGGEPELLVACWHHSNPCLFPHLSHLPGLPMAFHLVLPMTLQVHQPCEAEVNTVSHID